MPIIDSKATIHASAEDAFDLSQYYPLRLRWDPFIKYQKFLDGAQRADKGVRTLTKSRRGPKMISQYLTYKRPELVGMKMVDGPSFFRTFSGSWRFAPKDGGTCEVTFRYNFTCKPKFIAGIAEAIGKRVLQRDIDKRLEAFRKACDETDLIAEMRKAGG